MPTVKLSDLSVQKLKGSEKHTDYFDLTLPTFGIRVSPAGTKTFILKLRSGRQAIGRYPILSLSEARTEAKRLLAERTLGRTRPRSITYPQAVKLFIEDKKRSRRSTTAEQYQWFLGRLDFGQLADITHDDVERQLGKIGSKSTYDHVLIAARIFFNWCIRRRYMENNPTAGMSPHGTPQRSRVLTDEELGRIWRACEEANRGKAIAGRQRESLPGDPPPLPASCPQNGGNGHLPHLPVHFATIVKLLILTGQRRGEIAAIQSSWISSNTLTFPPAITKNGREHSIPLGDLSTAILRSAMEARPSGYLFIARGTTPFNGWSKASAALWKATGITGATLHDIRRTYRSTLGRIGVPPHIAERMVNHISSRSAVDRIYDRHTYMDEMREAVDRYEQHLRGLLQV